MTQCMWMLSPRLICCPDLHDFSVASSKETCRSRMARSGSVTRNGNVLYSNTLFGKNKVTYADCLSSTLNYLIYNLESSNWKNLTCCKFFFTPKAHVNKVRLKNYFQTKDCPGKAAIRFLCIKQFPLTLG